MKTKEGLPTMFWCEDCEQDVDATKEGKCIHCGEQVWEERDLDDDD